jgi:hypothetical protein
MPETRAAAGQAGGLVGVGGGDHDIPREDRARRVATALAGQGAHRGSGHHHAGHAVADSAAMIDLSGWRAVRIDPSSAP